MSNQIVVTGAAGWIGGHVCRVLRRLGWDVVGVSRSPEVAREKHPDRPWIGIGSELETAVQHAGRVLDLAGRNAFEQPWTSDFVEALRSSRIDPTVRIVDALARTRVRDPVLITASGYPACGDGGDRELADDAPARHELVLGSIDAEREDAALRAADRIRVAVMRIGLVLGPDGGAFPALRRPFDAGRGVVLGSGRQWVPWIHLLDVVALLTEVLADPGYRGVVNAVAPQPARHVDLARALGEVLGVSWQHHVPAARVARTWGGASELLLHSHRLVPARALELGFAFAQPDLGGAVKDIVAG
ncbi:MAG: hypothetical protein K0S40_662 [Actinomycetospora sp.]|jgi:uncharacterized protein (TIGR01777 family)|nr:hypothetical protein [Actinomycetospora sp.]